MKVGTIIQIHGTTGIVLEHHDKCALCVFSDGKKEWIYLPNYIYSESLKIITDKKCP